MADIFTKTKRSDVMSRIRSRGNRDTELALLRVFRANGIKGWRRQLQLRIANEELRTGGGRIHNSEFVIRNFKVRPDFVFSRLKLAVFVDGCFWHGCPQHATKPRNNAAFWRKKFAANQARDKLVSRSLRKAGWRVLRIWEHELAQKNEMRLIKRVKKALDSSLRP